MTCNNVSSPDVTDNPGEGGVLGGANRGVAATLSHIVRSEGATALYSGIVPGLQRQMAFSAIRIGAYERVSGHSHIMAPRPLVMCDICR